MNNYKLLKKYKYELNKEKIHLFFQQIHPLWSYDEFKLSPDDSLYFLIENECGDVLCMASVVENEWNWRDVEYDLPLKEGEHMNVPNGENVSNIVYICTVQPQLWKGIGNRLIAYIIQENKTNYFVTFSETDAYGFWKKMNFSHVVDGMEEEKRTWLYYKK